MKENNPRKGKVLYSLWITKEEEKILEALLSGYYTDKLGELISQINTRGDLGKR